MKTTKVNETIFSLNLDALIDTHVDSICADLKKDSWECIWSERGESVCMCMCWDTAIIVWFHFVTEVFTIFSKGYRC